MLLLYERLCDTLKLFSIDDFSWWIINDETEQAKNGFVDMSWVDIWTEPWVAQLNYRLQQDTTTWLTQQPLSFVLFDWTHIMWTTTKQLWSNSWTTWTLLHTNTNNGDNNDLIVYQNYLIYTSIYYIGRSTNTTIAWGFTDTPVWWSGTTFLYWTDQHYMKVFNNRLYISDWNYLAELDWASAPTSPWSWVFTNNKFVLPKWEFITSLEILSSYLVIWTESWNLYFWDWASANASDIVKTWLWNISAMLQLENTLFAFVWQDWVIYRYNWADLTPYKQIPNYIPTTIRKQAVRRYKNGFIFWASRNGIYAYSRIDWQDKFALTKYWPLSWWFEINVNQWDIYCLYITDLSSKIDPFIAWINKNWTYAVDRVNTTNRYRMEEAWSWNTSVSPYIETAVYELRDNNWKPNKVQWVQALFKDWQNRIQVEYRLDNNTSYTTLWTIWLTWININKILRWIWKRCNKIQFRIKMGSNFASTTDNTKLISLKIF